MIDETKLITWRTVGIVMIVAGILFCILMFTVLKGTGGFSGRISSPKQKSHWSSESEQTVSGEIFLGDAVLAVCGLLTSCLFVLSGIRILHAESLHKRRNKIDNG